MILNIKILLTKKWLELDKMKPLESKNLSSDLFPMSSELINYRLFEKVRGLSKITK